VTLEEFVARWKDSQAAERSNAQSFISDLCAVLGVPAPDPARSEGKDDYVFERPVRLPHEEGATAGFIDLYKRGAFVLEAKQGSSTSPRLGTAKRDTPQWTQAMQDAKGQALGYARVLDEPVPFLVVTDVGYCIDLYSCFDGSNGFRPFPTPLESRIFLRDLPQKPALVERLRTVLTNPHALDPSKRAIKVTREVAGHLANLAKSLEARHKREEVARFLMRCLFTMFAEDVELLPKKLFETLLRDHWIKEPYTFVDGLQALWEEMDEGKRNAQVGKLLRFNGGLFRDRTALRLNLDEMQILLLAALSDWSQVEPAIFGTLLERALDPKERHALGAHFTPRAYVERLVRPTVEEPLRDEWRAVRAEVRKLLEQEENKKAAKKLEDFLHRLSEVRVLDPACGTGNFLYVTLDVMKAIESEARALHASLGAGHQVPFGEGFSVTPRQLLGIEVNPWAKEIAELVLWIGYLQWHFKTHGKVNPPEPVLQDFHNIECRDAVLEYDEKVPRKGPDGQPLWRWDGETMKRSPVTGELVPDESARTQVFTYVNPRKAKWPAADYIVSNPPFIGGGAMRGALGEGYVEALRAAHEDMPDGSDFVLYWWNHAARLVQDRMVHRFGLITTKAISQTQARSVTEAYLGKKMSLGFALPNHPWVDGADAAAVRIAMTVGVPGSVDGKLVRVIHEKQGSDGEPTVELAEAMGRINSNLTLGPDVSAARVLKANDGLCCPGVKLHGSGFAVDASTAQRLGLGTDSAVASHLRPYLNGRDITAHSRSLYVIDLFGLSEEQAREKVPRLYQHLLEYVRPARAAKKGDTKDSSEYALRWWQFGKPRPELRKALSGLHRYVVTVETMKQRAFEFLDGSVVPDNMLTVVASDDAAMLGILSSRVHVAWALSTGGRLGYGNDPRYNKSVCFDKFPFPILSASATSAVRANGEALDRHRKDRQSEHTDLTLTGMYNVLEKLRSGAELTEKEKVIHEKGLVSVLKKLHDDLDAAVLDAYGWPHDLTDEQIVERLVALNAERAAEETNGLVRWLRPDFQAPESAAGKAAKAAKPVQASFAEPEPPAVPDGAPAPWPKELAGRMLAVRGVLQRGRTMTARDVAKSFSGRSDKDRIEAVTEVLAALRAMGQALAVEGSGETRWTPTARS
jgi:restriction-modification enzyme MmeI-like protein